MTEHLYINGRFLTQPLKGVQRFALGVTEQLIELGVPLSLIVPGDAALQTDRFQAHVVRAGQQSGQAWEQIDLPRELTRRGRPLLINFGNTAPLRYSNQVVTIHDVAFLHHPASYSRLFRLYYAALVPRLIRRARHTLTVSEFSRSEIVAAYPDIRADQISVVYNAADAHFSPGPNHAISPIARPRFLAFAADSDLKNDTTVRKAFLELAETQTAELRMVGRSARFPEAGRIETVGKDSRIVTLGRIDDARLKEEYRQAHAFIFGPKYAGFGIPPIEAQACGCPVLASYAASLPEVLGNSAAYFNPTDATSLVAAMHTLLADPARRELLIERGHVNRARFSWRRSAEQVCALLARLD